MKKWIAILASTILCAAGASADWQSIDTWDMNGNGELQTSENGLSLGNHYSSLNQQVGQIPDDGTFIFSPTTVSGFGAKTDFSSAGDLTAGVISISMSYTAMNWTNAPAANTKVGFRLWDQAKEDWIALEFLDSSNKIFAFIRTGGTIADVNQKTGRVINSLADDTTPRTVTMELDYVNNEIRVYADAWQWNNGSDVHTNSFDFAAAGITGISSIQTYYNNWGTGDTTTFDNLAVERFVVPEGVYIAASTTYEYKNVEVTNTFASLSVTNGDYIVVEAAVNKASWDADEITFAGSASLGAIMYDSFEGAGPEANLWYVPVTSPGTVDITLTATTADNTTAFASLGAYVVRSSTGGLDVLGQASVGSLTNDTSFLGFAYTNIYTFAASSTGLLFEAAASYMNDGNGISSDNLNYVLDLSDPGLQRKVGHAEFSGVSSITNIWTGTTNRQAAVFGIAFVSGGPISPTSQYEDFLAGGTDVGSADQLQDDADNDGLDNLTEYAFGGDAGDAGVQGNAPVQSQVSDGGTNYLEYIYYERTDAASRGLASILEVGTDLVITDWTTSGIEFIGSGAGPAGFNAVTNRISTDDDIKRFLNLQIEFTP